MNTKIVLSIKQMLHLEHRKLHTLDARLCWNAREYDEDNHVYIDHELIDKITTEQTIHKKNMTTRIMIPALTLQDILEKLPKKFTENDIVYKLILYPNPDSNEWIIAYVNDNSEEIISFKHKEVITAAYQMICWCLEQQYRYNLKIKNRNT